MTKTIGEATREEILDAYKWQHRTALQHAKLGRIFEDQTNAEHAQHMADAARWRRELAWALPPVAR